jgi:hypothetical protein
MDQTIINWILTCFGGLMGFLLKVMWEVVKDLQTTDKELIAKISDIEVLVAGKYVTREDLRELTLALFGKLEKIESLLHSKADK